MAKGHEHEHVIKLVCAILFLVSASPPSEYEGLALYRVSWLWYSFVCFAVTYLTGLIVSVLWPGELNMCL